MSTKKTRRTPVLWETAIAMWGKFSDTDIADQLNCSITTVGKYRAANNIPLSPASKNRRKGIFHAYREQIVPLLGQESDAKIAKKFHVRVRSVTKWRKKMQIPGLGPGGKPR